MRFGEIGARVACLQIGGGTGAVDEQRDQQQRDVADRRGHQDPHRAERTGAEAERQTGPAAAPLGDPAHPEGGERRAQREQRGGQPAERIRAEHVLGEQRADRHSGRQTGAAEDLAGDHHGEGPALHAIDLRTIDRPRVDLRGADLHGIRGGGGRDVVHND